MFGPRKNAMPIDWKLGRNHTSDRDMAQQILLTYHGFIFFLQEIM